MQGEMDMKFFSNVTIPQGLPILQLVDDQENQDSEKITSFTLNIDNLKHILLNERIADKKVAVISVAGAYRMGKSFLLNFFLRYLKYIDDKGMSAVDNEKWIKYEAKVNGFNWRSGTKPETMGVLVWSEPFIIRNAEGEDIAVLLVDTQGTFDHNSSMRECSIIFALSTLISSVQMYNLMRNIQEDNLQHLQFFTEYGKLAMKDGGDTKAFQSLLFTVRDWAFPDDFEDGLEGGGRFLDDVLSTENRKAENQELRKQIRASFGKLECCLMPAPGKRVSSSKFFSGKLSDIDEDFLDVIRELVPHVLHPRNIVVKKINGKPVTCRQLFEFVTAFHNMLDADSMFKPESMFTASAKVHNLAVMKDALLHYRTFIHEACDGGEFGINAVNVAHSECSAAAIDIFKNARKMGGEELSQLFFNQLLDEIDASFKPFLHKASMVESQNQTAYYKSLKFYNDKMLQLGEASMDEYQKGHNNFYAQATDLFNDSKVGDCESWDPHLKKLKSEIKSAFLTRSNEKSRVQSEQYDAIVKAKTHFCEIMDEMLGGEETNGTMEPWRFDEIYGHCHAQAINLFDETPKAGAESDTKKFRDMLDKDLGITGGMFRYYKLKPKVKVEYRDKCVIC